MQILDFYYLDLFVEISFIDLYILNDILYGLLKLMKSSD
jgi:hypothetical protein